MGCVLMPELWTPSGGVNRKLKELYTPSGGVNRKLKELYAVSGGVNRLIFSGLDAEVRVWVEVSDNDYPMEAVMNSDGSGYFLGTLQNDIAHSYSAIYEITFSEAKSCAAGERIFQMGSYFNRLRINSTLCNCAILIGNSVMASKDLPKSTTEEGEIVNGFSITAGSAIGPYNTWTIKFRFTGRRGSNTFEMSWGAGIWTVLGQQLNNVSLI